MHIVWKGRVTVFAKIQSLGGVQQNARIPGPEPLNNQSRFSLVSDDIHYFRRMDIGKI